MAVRGDEDVREGEIPSVSKTINTPTKQQRGEKLDSEEMRKRKAKEVQELMSSKSTWKLTSRKFEGHQTGSMVKMGGNTKGSKQALV